MTTENGLTHPRVIARQIEVLRGRVVFLEGSIEARQAAGHDAGFQISELQALRWAIPVLEIEHLHSIRLARLVLAGAGIVEPSKQDGAIRNGDPR